MSLISVRLSGFRTYSREKTFEFRPGVNCIIGANGSGKSNALAAIMYALRGRTGDSVAPERHANLHEGASAAVRSGFVEVTLGSSVNGVGPPQGRLLQLRVAFSAQKEEYFIDGKLSKKQHVAVALDALGLNFSHPYFFVKQGMIAELATMSNARRLKLLKEATGAHVFDERRAETLAALSETGRKKEKIDESIIAIETKLTQLMQERTELEQYRQLENSRRAAEGVLNEFASAEATRRENALQNEANRLYGAVALLDAAHQRATTQLAHLRHADAQIADQVHEENARLTTSQTHLAELETQLRKINSAIEDRNQKKITLATEKTAFEEELALVIKTLTVLETRIRQQLAPPVAAHHEKLNVLQTQIEDLDNCLLRQCEKAGFSHQFASMDDWTDAVGQQIQRSEMLAREQADQLSTAKSQIAAHNTQLAQAMEKQSQNASTAHSRSATLKDLENQLASIRKKHSELLEQRRRISHRRQTVTRDIREAERLFTAATYEHRKSVPLNIQKGFAAVEAFKKKYPDIAPAIHGPLLHLVTFPQALDTVVAVAAGKALWTIVVRDSNVVEQIFQFVQKDQCPCSIDMCSLQDTPTPRIIQSDTLAETDLCRVSKLLTAENLFTPVVENVFGAVLLVETLAGVSEMLAKTNTLVTIDGDSLTRGGIATAGGRRADTFAVGSYRKLQAALKVQEEHQTASRDLQNEYAQLDAKLFDNIKQIDDSVAQLSRATAEQHLHAEEKRGLDNEIQRLQTTLEQLLVTERETQTMIKQTAETIMGWRRQLVSWKHSEAAESQQLKQATKTMAKLKELREQQNQLVAEAAAGNDRLRAAQDAVRTTLLPRKNHLTEKLEKLENAEAVFVTQDHSEAAHGCLKDRELELKEEMQIVKDQIQTGHENLAKMTADKAVQLQELDQLLNEHTSLEMKLRGGQLECRAIQRKTAQLRKTQTTALGNRRAIPSLRCGTANLLTAYENMSPEEIRKEHSMLLKKLAQFGRVNCKAVDELNHLSEGHKNLKFRRRELDESHAAILQLIAKLDAKRHSILTNSFNKLQERFTHIFKELVPDGEATLTLDGIEPADRDALLEQANTQIPALPSKQWPPQEIAVPLHNLLGVQEDRADAFVGVGIEAQFARHSVAVQSKSIAQLSGGQKTVVALCLAFALSRCHPVSFYLLDEVDAALDPQYRLGIAKFIKKQAQAGSQFIVTTFRPELLAVADRVHEVAQRDRASIIQVIDPETASWKVRSMLPKEPPEGTHQIQPDVAPLV